MAALEGGLQHGIVPHQDPSPPQGNPTLPSPTLESPGIFKLGVGDPNLQTSSYDKKGAEKRFSIPPL